MAVPKMTTGSRHLLVVVLCLMQCFVITRGSEVSFQNSPSSVKQGLTDTLTLNCSVTETDPNLPIIVLDRESKVNELDRESKVPIIGKRDVTQTSANLLLLTSIVITKDGHDLASVNTAQPAHVMDGSANVQVSGSVSGKSGFVQLVITNPTVNQTGEYGCEGYGVLMTGHVALITTTVSVNSSQPTVADLVSYVTNQKQTINQLLTTTAQQTTLINNQKQTINQLLTTTAQQTTLINNQASTIGSLKQQTNALWNKFGIRLIGSHHIYEGTVEVTYQGRTGYVCDDSWDMEDVKVVCRMMGFRDGYSVKTDNYFGTQGSSSNIVLDDVRCSGTESSLLSCPHKTFGSHDCGMSELAGVTCTM